MPGKTLTLSGTPQQIVPTPPSGAGGLGGGYTRTMTITVTSAAAVTVSTTSAGTGVTATAFSTPAVAGVYSFDFGPNESVWAIGSASTSFWYPGA